MTRVTIVQTGSVKPDLEPRHGTYPQMFERMLRSVSPDVAIDVVSVIDGERLPEPQAIEAAIITGSAYGVYDDIDWMEPLMDFIRKVYVAHKPMVGVCFGHQAIAQAMGGTVTKSEKGWGIGRHVYNVVEDNGLIAERDLAIACSHQDQVVVPPPEARVFLSSEFTPYAGLLYGNGKVMSVQPHPEFTADYALALCESRRGIAPETLIEEAERSLDLPSDRAILARAITQFLGAAD
ncbi:type 1 glutamine amidotransferase [Consotaella salsifontis]|uniref:GMP synthase-Glutamine amidotransferase n=1 Tax=Consotaella salsifontis TaxID=1365950 RepID=A0A1T4NI98_9HYPH|nr:type 1 glutamine amidotransferase [Consotaella salsifontis]SJZ78845.1 GMP synthase-Glutamine amidotransferase [Consotaella salsifontis]